MAAYKRTRRGTGSRGRHPAAAGGRDPVGGTRPRPADRPQRDLPPLIGRSKSQAEPFTWHPELAGLDFYVATGHRPWMAGVLKCVSSWFGEPTHMRGRYLYADRWRWPNGTELLFTDAEDGTNAEHFCLSIPGGALAEWEPAERLDRTWELWQLGATSVKRADLPLDFKGEGVTLLADVEAAKQRGELCGHATCSRVVEDRPDRNGGRRVTGESLYIGKRGNGCFSVNGYDKGLEQSQGRGRPGQWIRWEPRFEGFTAQAVMARLWAARRWEREHKGQQTSLVFKLPGWLDESGVGEVTRSWQEEYVSLSLGCVDFREPAHGKSRLLSRRLRASWWTAVLGSITPARVRLGRRRYPSLTKNVAWMRRCVMPVLLKEAELTGQSVQEVLVNQGLDRVSSRSRSQVAYEYAARLARGAA